MKLKNKMPIVPPAANPFYVFTSSSIPSFPSQDGLALLRNKTRTVNYVLIMRILIQKYIDLKKKKHPSLSYCLQFMAEWRHLTYREFLHVWHKYIAIVIVSNVRNFLVNLRNLTSLRGSCTCIHLTQPYYSTF